MLLSILDLSFLTCSTCFYPHFLFSTIVFIVMQQGKILVCGHLLGIKLYYDSDCPLSFNLHHELVSLYAVNHLVLQDMCLEQNLSLFTLI